MISGLPWGLALSTGFNTYLPLLLVALIARFGDRVTLAQEFKWLTSDQTIFILGVLAVCEVLAQKFPVVDNAWDFVHTLLRPLAGGLAAGATSGTHQAFELILAMLVGGTLAAAGHSTKSGLRLMSTSKSFGTTNLVLSLGEDAAVVAGTLLSVYAPWVMLGVVVLFVVIFALVGPRIFRALWFNLRVGAAWFSWLWARILRRPLPADLRESLLEASPDRLRSLGEILESGEELLGALNGWRRSGRGPRASWLLITSRRLVWVERRIFGRSRTQDLPYADLAVARCRNLGFFAKLDLLTRQNESYSLSLRKTHAVFGKMAVEKICELAGLVREPDRFAEGENTKLASVRF